jgi:MFS family permease
MPVAIAGSGARDDAPGEARGEADVAPKVTRSFVLGVLNGALYRVSEAFIHPQTVLTWFLAQLGASNVLIGMIDPLRRGSAFLLQLAISGHLERRAHKLPFYRLISLVRCVGLLGLAAAIALIPLGSPWLLVVFFLIFTAYSMGAGLVAIPFMDIVGKAIPAEHRGSFFSQRLLWGGVLGIGASALTGYLLSAPPGLSFPRNVALLVALGALALGLAAFFMSLIAEPPSAGTTGDVLPWVRQIGRGFELLREDRGYRIFVLVRLALSPARWSIPFFTVYAQHALDIPPARIGFYLGARTVASLISNLLWGVVSDRHGNRRLMRISITVGLLMPLAALLIGVAGEGAPPARRDTLSYVFAVVFVGLGAYESSSFIAYVGYLLDLAPESQRPLYTATNSTLFGMVGLLSFMSGIIVDVTGYATLMTISTCCFAVALAVSLRMEEPRAR